MPCRERRHESKPTSWVDDTDGEEDDEGGREVGHGRIDMGSHPVGHTRARHSMVVSGPVDDTDAGVWLYGILTATAVRKRVWHGGINLGSHLVGCSRPRYSDSGFTPIDGARCGNLVIWHPGYLLLPPFGKESITTPLDVSLFGRLEGARDRTQGVKKAPTWLDVHDDGTWKVVSGPVDDYDS